MSAAFAELADLRGLRTAPLLPVQQRLQLQEELRQRVALCDWCTIGIMAPTPEAALACLQSFERALDWPKPQAVEGEACGELAGPVFLKGHQRTGLVRLRAEEGLGEGVLVSGHSDSEPEHEGTWGPLPLDFFLPEPSAPELGATGL